MEGEPYRSVCQEPLQFYSGENQTDDSLHARGTQAQVNHHRPPLLQQKQNVGQRQKSHFSQWLKFLGTIIKNFLGLPPVFAKLDAHERREQAASLRKRSDWRQCLAHGQAVRPDSGDTDRGGFS